MMKLWHWALWLFVEVLLLMSGGACHAADLVLKDGSTYEDCRVSCYTRDANGAGVFNVSLPDDENGGTHRSMPSR